jgi:hypothetical protein
MVVMVLIAPAFPLIGGVGGVGGATVYGGGAIAMTLNSRLPTSIAHIFDDRWNICHDFDGLIAALFISGNTEIADSALRRHPLTKNPVQDTHRYQDNRDFQFRKDVKKGSFIY